MKSNKEKNSTERVEDVSPSIYGEDIGRLSLNPLFKSWSDTNEKVTDLDVYVEAFTLIPRHVVRSILSTYYPSLSVFGDLCSRRHPTDPRGPVLLVDILVSSRRLPPYPGSHTGGSTMDEQVVRGPRLCKDRRTNGKESGHEYRSETVELSYWEPYGVTSQTRPERSRVDLTV